MNKKGFTLIELLAVVVVLGIIMVLSVTTILPYMENARKQTFATEAEVLKKSAEQAVSLINIGQITNSYTKGPGDYCFTLDDLRKLGLFKKDNSKYNGAVVVRQSNNSYKYYVKLENGEYYILQSNASNIESSDVQLLTDELIADSANIFSCSLASEQAYAIYTESDGTLRFTRSEIPLKKGDLYNKTKITEVYTGFEDKAAVPWKSIKENIKEVIFDEEITPVSVNSWFALLVNATKIDLTNLNTSMVTDMSHMFWKVNTPNIIGLANLDTSNVTNMSSMFYEYLKTATNVYLDLSGWDVSNVTNMSDMLRQIGYQSEEVIIDVSNWDVSNVTNMSEMFAAVGCYAKSVTINGLTDWDTRNVTNMSMMFNYVGFFNAKTCNIGDLSEKQITKNGITYKAWDVSNVINMKDMFRYSKLEFFGNIGNWNVSSVTDMSGMFEGARQIKNYTLDLSAWDTGEVTKYEKFDQLYTGKIILPTWKN